MNAREQLRSLTEKAVTALKDIIRPHAEAEARRYVLRVFPPEARDGKTSFNMSVMGHDIGDKLSKELIANGYDPGGRVVIYEYTNALINCLHWTYELSCTVPTQTSNPNGYQLRFTVSW
jgi:hypothetical protein